MTKSLTLKRAFLPIVAVSMALSFPATADEEDHEHTPLEKAMKISSNALKSLRKMDKSDWAGGAKAARTAADDQNRYGEFKMRHADRITSIARQIKRCIRNVPASCPCPKLHHRCQWHEGRATRSRR